MKFFFNLSGPTIPSVNMIGDFGIPPKECFGSGLSDFGCQGFSL